MSRAGVFPARSLLLVLIGVAFGAVGVALRTARVPAMILLLIGVVVALAGIVGLWRGPRWGAVAVLGLLGLLFAGSVAAEAWILTEAWRGQGDLIGAIVGCGLFVLVFGTATVLAWWAYRGRAPRG